MLLTVPSERVEKAKNPPAQQENTMSCPFLPYGTHSSPREMGCGEERRGCHFFWSLVCCRIPLVSFGLSLISGEENNFLFLFFF